MSQIEKIYIGADHGGFERKGQLIEFLKSQGYEIEDKGAYELNPEDDYPQFAFAVAENVIKNPNSLGILICRSSIGVAVAANKVKGVFASVLHTVEDAKNDKEHHNSNVVTLSADYLTLDEMKAIIESWFNADFLGGKYQRRLDQIFNYENKNG